MTGGHGTSAAFGSILEDMDLGLQRAATVSMAAATFGLIAGSIIGGPVANQIITKKKLMGTAVSEEKIKPESSLIIVQREPVDSYALAAFDKRVAKLIAWYDGFIPAEGMSYSGDRVKTEAIADMTSMKCLLYIARQTEGFDYDAFFRQYAKLWRDQSTPESMKEVILMDPHPVHYLRINATLAQFDDFDDFYGIKEGDRMYLLPEDRVAVW